MVDPATNPYQAPANISEIASNRPSRLAAFRNGFVRGTLWSSIVAVFGGFGIFGEYAIGRSRVYDPISRTSNLVDLSLGDYLYCLLATTVTVLLMIVLPWASIAGIVHMIRHGNPSPSNGKG